MRSLSAMLIIAAACQNSGCSRTDKAAEVVQAAAEPAPQDAGLTLAFGDSKEIRAPQGSATAESTWIQFAVTYQNRSKKSLWLHGYSPEHVFHELESRADEQGEWIAYGLGYCGMGATEHEIHPGESHTFAVALPERYRGNEFRVVLNYRAAGSSQASRRAESPPQKVAAK